LFLHRGDGRGLSRIRRVLYFFNERAEPRSLKIKISKSSRKGLRREKVFRPPPRDYIIPPDLCKGFSYKCPHLQIPPSQTCRRGCLCRELQRRYVVLRLRLTLLRRRYWSWNSQYLGFHNIAQMGIGYFIFNTILKMKSWNISTFPLRNGLS
jgi:hypothetical protein